MTNTETAGAGAASDRPMQHDEALQRAGMVAIRMGREGDSQAAETVRAQIARIQALEADNQTLRTGYAAARLEIESLRGLIAEPAGEYPALPEHGTHCIGDTDKDQWSYSGEMMRSILAYRAMRAAQPAPSAALAQLRHIFTNLKNGGVRDTAQAKRIADGLLGPVIESLERAQVAPAAVAGPHVTDAMALDFHSALSDGALGSDEVEDIKAGLRAALAAAPTTQPAPKQEAQEPVAWYVTGCGRLLDEYEAKAEARHIGGTAKAMPLYTVPQPAPQQEAQEPVAWLDPWTGANVTTDYDVYGKHGIPLYTAPKPVVREPLTDEQVESAAKVLAASSWDHMPEKGRETMRWHVRAVIAAATAKP